MGLKVIIAIPPSSLISDKIRPKWDWKEKFYSDVIVTAARIKSDQNGIESNVFLSTVLIEIKMIKSDQNGIESRIYTALAKNYKKR